MHFFFFLWLTNVLGCHLADTPTYTCKTCTPAHAYNDLSVHFIGMGVNEVVSHIIKEPVIMMVTAAYDRERTGHKHPVDTCPSTQMWACMQKSNMLLLFDFLFVFLAMCAEMEMLGCSSGWYRPSSNFCGCEVKQARKCHKLQFLKQPCEASYKTNQSP